MALLVAVEACSVLPTDVQPLADNADELSQTLDEYGSASMSSPVLTSPGSTFNFTLTGVTPTTFYTDAKQAVNSQTADFATTSQMANLALAASFAPGTTASLPTLGPTSVPTALFAATTQPFSLLGKSSATISDHDALTQAAADAATYAIFQALGDQTLVSKFTDKKVVMGVVTVAVDPGWRTRRGYSVDLSTQATYTYAPARLAVVQNLLADTAVDLGIRKRVAMTYGLQIPFGPADPFGADRAIPPEYRVPTDAELHRMSPAVAAVSPITQSQVNQGQNSRDSQVQLALSLAGAFARAGLGVQASAFSQYANSLQQDVSTVDLFTTVNTYTVNGGVFGFDVGPRLRAVENASLTGSGPGTVLDRQSFPALIMFGFDADDLRPRVQFDPFGQLRVYEPRMKLTTFTTWHPLDANAPRLRVQDRLGRFQRYLEARRQIDQATERQAAAEVADDVNDLLDGLAMQPAEPVGPIRPKDAKRVPPAPRLGIGPQIMGFRGLGDAPRAAADPADPSTPFSAAHSIEPHPDAKTRWANLASAVAVKADAVQRDRSSRPLYSRLQSYRGLVIERGALEGLPEANADTALRYLEDAQSTQLDAIAKSVDQSIPKPDPATKTQSPADAAAAAVLKAGQLAVANRSTDYRKQIIASIEATRQLDRPSADQVDVKAIQDRQRDLYNALAELNAHLNGQLVPTAVSCPDQMQDLGSATSDDIFGFFERFLGFRSAAPPAVVIVEPFGAAVNAVSEAVTSALGELAAPRQKPKKPAPTPKPPDQRAAEETGLRNIADDVNAAVDLLAAADSQSTARDEIDRSLNAGAIAVQEALFPEEYVARRSTASSTLRGPFHDDAGDSAPPSARADPPSDDNVQGVALTYARDLLSKAFGAIYDEPLPVQLIEPPAVKHPTVTRAVTDFTPTWGKPFPAATDTVTVTLTGTDLDAIDPTLLPTALELMRSDAAAGAPDPVTIIGMTPPPTATSVTVQLTINPTYRLPLALQFKLLDGTDVLNSLPFATGVGTEVPASTATVPVTVIRRTTGPANDPSQQQRDELDLIGPAAASMNPDVLKAKIEESKPETRHKVDVNIGLSAGKSSTAVLPVDAWSTRK